MISLLFLFSSGLTLTTELLLQTEQNILIFILSGGVSKLTSSVHNNENEHLMNTPNCSRHHALATCMRYSI